MCNINSFKGQLVDNCCSKDNILTYFLMNTFSAFYTNVDSFLRSRSSTDHEATAMMKAQFMSLWDGMKYFQLLLSFDMFMAEFVLKISAISTYIYVVFPSILSSKLYFFINSTCYNIEEAFAGTLVTITFLI